jgi:hypothetical protein
MVSHIPTLVAPSTKTWLGIERELVVGTPKLPDSVTSGNAATMPLDKSQYEPEDTPHWLPDEAIRGSMAQLFAEVQGPEEATWSLGGPVFGNVFGYFLDNIFGDMASSGATTASTTTITSPTVIGATTCTVASATGHTSGTLLQIGSGSTKEIVKLGSSTSGTAMAFANYPLRFAHSSAAAASLPSGPFTHKFGTLNSGSGQPPTHTATDYTSLTTTVGARSYPSLCIAQIDFTGNAEQLFMMKVTGTSWQSAAASSAPTNTTTFDVPIASWRTAVQVAGSPVYDIGEWAVSIKRELQVYWTTQGAQTPYIIARGTLDCTGTINYTVPSDETPLTQMLNNTQPTLDISISNGLTSTSLISFDIHATKAAFIKSKPVRSAVLVGYEDEFQTVANTTDVGGSAGLGQVTVTLVNNTPTY